MTSEAIRETYMALSETLNSTGLGWIVHQVEASVREGRPIEKEARIFRDEEPGEADFSVAEESESARRPGRATLMMTLEPWPDDCRLLFLIDAIRHAIVHAAAVENDQLRLLRTVGNVELVRFAPEGDHDDERPFDVRGLNVDRIEELAHLLDGLEAEVRA